MLDEGERVGERKLRLGIRRSVDDQHELALGRRCGKILDRLAERRAYRLLMELCQLAAQRNAAIRAEGGFHVLERAH